MESKMYRVLTFAILTAGVSACGESATMAEPDTSANEVAQLPAQAERVEAMVANTSEPSAQPSAAHKEGDVARPANSGKKPVVPPGREKEIKPSPLVAPAEIDPVPPPVEDAQPQQD